MFEQTVGAKVDWQEPALSAPEKTWQDLWGFKVSETEPVMFVTATNDLGAHLESAIKGVLYWVNNWNTPTNTSGTISSNLPISGEPHFVLTCNRNGCNRPWLDELSEIRPAVLKVNSERSATGLMPIAELSAWEVNRPVAPSRQREIEWLSSNTDMLYAYQGNWIAIEGDKIVAWGSDEVEVEMQAKTKGVKIPLLFRVPAETDKPFIGYNPHDCSSI